RRGGFPIFPVDLYWDGDRLKCAIVRDKGRKKMTVLTDFNKLFDDMAAALRLKKPAQEAREKVVAAIDEARKTDPELAERLIRRSEYRERLRLKCPPELRELIQAKIEKQNCKCAGCGGPLDVDQQMIFDPPNMVCEFCCEEMIADTMK